MADDFNILDTPVSSGMPFWPGSRNLTTTGLPNAFTTTGGAYSLPVIDRLYLTPFYVPIESMTVNSVAIDIFAADIGPTVRAGLYSVDSDGLPDELLFISPVFDLSSSGERHVTLTLPVDIQGGAYYTALASTGNTTSIRRNNGFTGNFAGRNPFLLDAEGLYNTLSPGWSTFPDNPTIDGTEAIAVFTLSLVG